MTKLRSADGTVKSKAPSTRLPMAEAALYVNKRLNKPWSNPQSAFEANVYRKKIVISRHGRANNKRTFTIKELDRFIESKNKALNPFGGQARIDLSEHEALMSQHSDGYVAKKAGCSLSTVVRYRKRHNIPAYRRGKGN